MDNRLHFVLECRLNACQNKIRDAEKELGLLIHWILNFDKMNPIYQNEVIRQLNKENKSNDFYKDLVVNEVEE